jgi:hypothetical protein
MPLKNILKKVAAMVGLDIDFDDESAAEDKDVLLLVNCADSVCSEIAAEYLPLIFEEDILFAEGGSAGYAVFSRRPVNIVSLKASGVNVAYTVFPDRIYVKGAEGKRLTVRYAYLPSDSVGLDSEFVANPAVTERTAALGIAAEYSLINGMFNESVLYDRRYKDSLRSAMRKRGETRIRGRRFI